MLGMGQGIYASTFTNTLFIEEVSCKLRHGEEQDIANAKT